MSHENLKVAISCSECSGKRRVFFLSGFATHWLQNSSPKYFASFDMSKRPSDENER